MWQTPITAQTINVATVLPCVSRDIIDWFHYREYTRTPGQRNKGRVNRASTRRLSQEDDASEYVSENETDPGHAGAVRAPDEFGGFAIA